VVLILGRFSTERKPVLEALRRELRRHDYIAVLFDFDRPSTQSTPEMITTLAGMARFLLADITDAKSVLQELQAIVPTRPSLSVQPILIREQQEPGMFDFFRHFAWVRKTWYYTDQADLLASIEQVIERAEGNVAAGA
jgi:hypothetical protein